MLNVTSLPSPTIRLSSASTAVLKQRSVFNSAFIISTSLSIERSAYVIELSLVPSVCPHM